MLTNIRFLTSASGIPRHGCVEALWTEALSTASPLTMRNKWFHLERFPVRKRLTIYWRNRRCRFRRYTFGKNWKTDRLRARKVFEVVWSINKNILEATQRCVCKQKKMAVSDTRSLKLFELLQWDKVILRMKWRRLHSKIYFAVSRTEVEQRHTWLARGLLARLSASLQVVLKGQEWSATVSTRLWWCCCVDSVASLRFSWFGWVHLKEVGGFMQNYNQIVFHSTTFSHHHLIRCSTHSDVKKGVMKFKWHPVHWERARFLEFMKTVSNSWQNTLTWAFSENISDVRICDMTLEHMILQNRFLL